LLNVKKNPTGGVSIEMAEPIQPTSSTFVFSVFANVGKKWGYERKLLTAVLVVLVTFLYIIILLCYVNKLNSSMSNFGGRLGQPKKNETYSRDFFFCANIIQQVVDFLF
jgi:hypothetical protein